ncbi:MAG: bifunctional adenosylcobinamide kinase/adenosylcobinamide-phosphate guanylyltransferase [Chloroflexi bacterium]|nr:bifunctional adenosylcobinamide kinase/adenosylcobinamide-phosphate guanylyltransferase [Chloroflexota bacterium]
MGKLILLLGGARSGKSRYAETWAREHGEQVLFVATAQAFDDEMRERIARHRAERPPGWQTLEAPSATGKAVREAVQSGAFDVVLLDCITLLASNILLSLPDDCTQDDVSAAILAEIDSLLDTLAQTDATWLVVSNEVGMGIVPPTRLGRFYRDGLGRANQQLAHAADQVFLLVAGLAWKLK